MRRKYLIGLSVFLCIGLGSCKEEALTGMPDWLGSSVYDWLSEDGNYHTYLKLVEDIGYSDVLKKTGSKTVFVADDEAFQRFYQANSWGVSCYEDFTLSQKKLMMNSSIINNAYLIELMSSTSGPEAGKSMRRTTALSAYDSVPCISVEEMPNTKYWSRYKNSAKYQTNGMYLMKDATPAPMIHFLQEQLALKKITDEDFAILTGSVRQGEEANINGIKVVQADITCQNGYIHQLERVSTPLKNMAEIIRTDQRTTLFSHLLERYSAPYFNQAVTDEYNRIYNAQVDSVFVKHYFSASSASASGTPTGCLTAPNGEKVVGSLTFDPGWNTYVFQSANQITLNEDMGAMLVPSDEALTYYWNHGGKVLQDKYLTWNNVPDDVLAKLINNQMLSSFVSSVPSKFGSLTNDAKDPLGAVPEDITGCELGCNGAVYITNKVYSPAAYSSVSFPALINSETMGIIYWAVENLEFSAYLNAMDIRYSFLIPTNEAMLHYIDPVSYGQANTVLYQFYYDAKARTVKAHRFNYDVETGEKLDSLTDATTAQIANRMTDLMDNLIIVGDIESGKRYYQTKGGSIVEVVNPKNGTLEIYGGWQAERGTPLVVNLQDDVYDMSTNGNGKTYILHQEPVLTEKKSAYKVLSEHPEYSSFFNLMLGSGFFSSIVDLHACVDNNVTLFNTYNYTIYVPTNESIDSLVSSHLLPSWDEVEANPVQVEKDSLTKVINDFIRFHIQDNSVFVDNQQVSGNFETATVDPETGRFHKLTVVAGPEGISITDKAGHTRRVLLREGLYNNRVREYQYDNPDVELSTALETSSCAVIHLIDGPLFYQKDQLVNQNQQK